MGLKRITCLAAGNLAPCQTTDGWVLGQRFNDPFSRLALPGYRSGAESVLTLDRISARMAFRCAL